MQMRPAVFRAMHLKDVKVNLNLYSIYGYRENLSLAGVDRQLSKAESGHIWIRNRFGVLEQRTRVS
jgi:hypothetical protein